MGVKVVQDQENVRIWIGQPVYTENVLQKFGMETAKPVGTPVDTGTKLVKSTDESEVDQTLISQQWEACTCRLEQDLISRMLLAM